MMLTLPKYDCYKDSGVDWLGEIPTHWEVIIWRRIINILTDYTANGSFADLDKNVEYLNEPNFARLVRLTDLRKGLKEDSQGVWISEKSYKYLKKSALFGGELLIANVGAYSGIAFQMPNIDQPASLAPNMVLVKFNEKKVNNKFIFYSINCVYIQKLLRIKALASSAQPKLNKNDFRELISILPPLEEQEKIVKFLDKKCEEVEEAIALKQRLITLLEEQKSIVINQAVTKGLNPHAPMKDTGIDWLGDIPAHWEVLRTKNIFQLITQPAPNNNNYELLSVYTDIGVKPRKELEERGNKASTTDGYWMVKKGDVIVNKLLAWMGAIGISDYDGVTSPAYDILRPYKPVESKFYHYLFRNPICLSKLKQHSKGIMEMRLRLYFDEFGNIKLPYPSFEEQEKIVKYLENKTAEIEELKEKTLQQIEKLKEFKQILIAEAVTGKIKV